MPLNYDYSEPERLITPVRLSSYQNSINTENNAQLFGVYNWNLALVGAFYPLIQVIEVALRNAVCNAAKEMIQYPSGSHWFESVPSRTTAECPNPTQVKDFRDKISKAKRSAKQALERKGIDNPTPSYDQIIANTDFATWELLLDKHFYDGSDPVFLWPLGLTKVFKKLPRYVGRNAMFHQRDLIRRRIEEVRLFRNRISHNEPPWRVSSGNSREGIIQGLQGQLNDMMELLFWISPKFKRYVKDVGLESRISQLLNIDELNRYMHLSSHYTVEDLDDLSELIQIINSDNIRCSLDVNGNVGLLTPRNTLLVQ